MFNIIGVEKIRTNGNYYYVVNYNNVQTIYPKGCGIPYEVIAFLNKANAYPCDNKVFYKIG